MDTFFSLNIRTRFYWVLVVMLGAAGAVDGISYIHRGETLNILIWASFAVAIAGFKIRLPGITGTLSLNYVVILAVLLNQGLGAGMIVALTSTLGQCFIYSQVKPRWYQVLFSVAGVSLPVLVANLALRSPYLVSPASESVAVLAASIAYFVVNTVSVAGIISLTAERNLYDVWRTSYLWTWPQYLVGGGIGWVIHLLEKNLGWGSMLVAAPSLYLLYHTYTTYLGRIQEQQDHLLDMAALHLRTIETLALAIDAKDETTAAHLRRVQIYAAGIGNELDLSPLEMQALNAAAVLHDVGKLAVPEYIISKPGKLTPEEFEKMKVHPVVGAEILERVNFPYPVVPIVRSHHEKYDGTGYPDGLIGDAIPIGARILAVVDCLDALASDRQYRQALPLDEAMAIVAGQAGKAFDPKIVALMQVMYRDLEKEAKSQTVDTRAKLSTHVKVARGLAPATGFASTKAMTGSEPRPENDFSRSIANARMEIQLLTEVINDLGNSLSLDDTLALLAVRLAKAVRHDAIAVYLIRDEKLIPRFVKGESYRLFSSLQIPVGQGLSGWVAENDKAIVNANPAVEPGYLNDPRMTTPLRSAIAIPLRSQDRMVGVLTLYSLGAEAFTADDNRLLLAIAPKAAHAIENSLRFERAASAADTDELTGLANARFLFSHLAKEVTKCSETEGAFSVIVMDLDGFKKANDQYGHLAGNRILQAIARHLRTNTRVEDVVARLGGDEFVVVMNESKENVNEYISHINQIAGRLEAEVQCEAAVSISAGVARYPEDGTDAETLLERADERMYEAKRRKQSRVVEISSAA
jgi:diguanylate cyclase (GGDEF)-like protein/putative nucleotidyltransferase with HDIG domain